MHYRKWLLENAAKPGCNTTGCLRPARAKGVCLRHYRNERYHAGRDQQLALEAADPSLRRANPCRELDCGEPPFEFALCLLHYNQWLQSTAHLPRCAWNECERPKQVRGMCSKHEQRVRYYQRAAGLVTGAKQRLYERTP
jgi:hypothetical protein